MYLREWRKSKGLKQREVADQIGENRATYAKWEAGTPPPPPEVRKKLEEILHFDGEYREGNAYVTPEDLEAVQENILDHQGHIVTELKEAREALAAMLQEVLKRLPPPDKNLEVQP